MKKYGLLNTIVLLFISTISFASHLIGGETSYKCLGNDIYEITYIYYRDCRPESEGGGSHGALVDDQYALFTIYRGNDFFLIDSIVFTDIQQLSNINNYVCLNITPNSCISKLTFTFVKNLPSSPIPYTIINQRCCLNNSILNIEDAGSNGNSLICTIPPNICNKSAVFKPIKTTFLCANKQYKIDHSAIDDDGDSLSYELCALDLGADQQDPKPKIINPNIPIIKTANYKFPYTATRPINSINIDEKTGLLTIKSNTQGVYVATVCCKEWRNGVVINTNKRSYTYTINNCDFNVLASMKCDTILEKYTTNNQCFTNCQSKTISFESNSIGANNLHWDFGVANVDDDTSNISNPIFTFPSTGNYTVKLVAYGSSCNDSITKTITIGEDNITADFTNSSAICTGKEIQFTDASQSTNHTINKWQWIFNSPSKEFLEKIQNPKMTFYEGGNYKTQLFSFNDIGCYAIKEKEFELEKINVVAYSDTTIPKSSPYTISATGTNQYLWYYNGVNTILSGTENNQSPTINFNNTGKSTYIVIGSNADGCAGSDTISVLVTSNAYFIVPTAFSPNNDFKNDELKILSSGYILKSFKIFNRRGQQVFTTNNIYDKWDGNFKNEPLGIDTYNWFAIVKDETGKEKLFKGDVTLVR